MTSIRQLLSGHTEVDQELTPSYTSQQLVSLELGGQLVVWTILDHQRDYDQHLGLAHWGQVGYMNGSTKDTKSFSKLKY